MKTKLQKYLFYSSLLLCLLSCKKEKNTVDVGYGYFPNEAGKYVVYDVDSIVFDEFNSKIDTFRFQVKEYIQSIYPDNTNRPTQRIERYVKKFNKSISYDLLPWVLCDVWSANRTASTAEKVEENERFIKLVFSVKTDKTWDGNVQNTRGAQTYKYSEANTSGPVGGIAFDSVLTVLQLDKENLIEKQYYREMYAKNVGMIFKEMIDVKAKTINSNYIMDRITSGLIYRATVRSFGSY